MTEHDPLDDLLRKWKSPEPTPELDRRVISAYRSSQPFWRRFWKTRVSVPAPVFALAVLALLTLFFFWRPSTTPVTPAQTPGAVTSLNVSGFQPLPNGEARIIPAMEIKK